MISCVPSGTLRLSWNKKIFMFSMESITPSLPPLLVCCLNFRVETILWLKIENHQKSSQLSYVNRQRWNKSYPSSRSFNRILSEYQMHDNFKSRNFCGKKNIKCNLINPGLWRLVHFMYMILTARLGRVRAQCSCSLQSQFFDGLITKVENIENGQDLTFHGVFPSLHKLSALRGGI